MGKCASRWVLGIGTGVPCGIRHISGLHWGEWDGATANSAPTKHRSGDCRIPRFRCGPDYLDILPTHLVPGGPGEVSFRRWYQAATVLPGHGVLCDRFRLCRIQDWVLYSSINPRNCIDCYRLRSPHHVSCGYKQRGMDWLRSKYLPRACQ